MTTYSEIATRVIQGCENDESDFLSNVPSFVNSAEDELLRRIDSFWMDTETSLQLSSSRLTLPELKLIKHLRVQVSSRSINLIMQDEAWVREYWPEETSVGVPKYYARTSGDEILVAPAPSSNIPIFVKGLAKPLALSSVNVSNVILNRAETALFYGAMKHANLYMKAWKTAAEWERLCDKEVELYINESRRGRRDSTRQPNANQSANNLIPNVP